MKHNGIEIPSFSLAHKTKDMSGAETIQTLRNFTGKIICLRRLPRTYILVSVKQDDIKHTMTDGIPMFTLNKEVILEPDIYLVSNNDEYIKLAYFALDLNKSLKK